MGTEEVVAIVLEDVTKELSFSYTIIKASIETGGFGVHKNIVRGKTAIKWKYCAMKLSSLPKEIQLRLKSGPHCRIPWWNEMRK